MKFCQLLFERRPPQALVVRSRMVACAFVLASVGAHAQAQTSSRSGAATDTAQHHRWWRGDYGLAIGPGVGWQRYGDQVSGRETALTAVGGLFHGSKLGPEAKSGFVPAFKVTLFPSKVSAVAAADPNAAVLGTIRLRPMMLGIGWFHPLSRAVSVRLTGLGGWSFNSLGDAETSDGRPAFPVASAPTAISSSIAWETSGKLWISTSPNVAFITGVSLIHARPELTLADGSRRDWNADHIRLDAGVAFTIFRWHRD